MKYNEYKQMRREAEKAMKVDSGVMEGQMRLEDFPEVML